MRNIIFRDKRVDNGEWVEGDLLLNTFEKYPAITNKEMCKWDFTREIVDENTIGQFTGLTDCKGKKIWENDIVKHCAENKPAIVNFIDGKFTIEKYGYNLSASKCFKVIGNIYDNSDLIGGKV